MRVSGPFIEREPNRSTYMRGVPIPPDKQVRGDEGWLLDPDQGSWAMQNVEQFLDVAMISRGSDAPTPLHYRDCDLFDRTYTVLGERRKFRETCEMLKIDALLFMKNDTVLIEYYRNGMTPVRRHSMNSVTKTLIGMLTGCLSNEGKLDLNEPLQDRFPQLRNSGAGDATLQHALDMTIGIHWPMSQSDPDSMWFQNFRAGGFLARPDDFPFETTLDLVATAPKSGEHGATFFYASACTELLGWAVSSAVGRPWQDEFADRIWSRIGSEHDAFVVVDKGGHGLATCGASATLRDLTRFGQMLANEGKVSGQSVVPKEWIRETLTPSDASVSCWRSGRDQFSEIAQFYRNQCRVLKDHEEGVATGGLGQRLFFNCANRTVLAVYATAYDRSASVGSLELFRTMQEAT